MENLIDLFYQSTHHYVIDYGKGKLLVDPGWGGSLAQLKSQLKAHGIDLPEIKLVMITHCHPDHAGLAQEVKIACGAKLLIHEKQAPFLSELAAFHAKKGGYVPIVVSPSDVVVSTPNRTSLAALGIQGELVHTPGHSDDSFTLLLDSGMAFVGDLTPPQMAGEDNAEMVWDSWQRLVALHAQTFYPAHSAPVSAEEINTLLLG